MKRDFNCGLVGRLAKQETGVDWYVLRQWVVAQFALGFGARWRQCLDASLRIDSEHVLWTNLPIEAAKCVQDVLFERVVCVLATGGRNLVLGTLLPLSKATTNGVVSVVLGDSRRVIQMVDCCQKSIHTIVPIIRCLEHFVNQTCRVYEEFYFRLVVWRQTLGEY